MEKKEIKKPVKTPVGYMFDGTLDSVYRENGYTYLTLKTGAEVKEDILDLYGQKIECAIKKIKAKRSSNANNYCWELCAQIGSYIHLGSIDIYKEAVRHRGMYKDYEIPMDEVDNVNKMWGEFGIGWFTEKVDNAPDGNIILRCYYGTSSYNSTQMSDIIDFLVDEATNLGLTTLSKKMRDNLIDKWEAFDIAKDE